MCKSNVSVTTGSTDQDIVLNVTKVQLRSSFNMCAFGHDDRKGMIP